MWALIAVGVVAIAAIIAMILLNQQPPEPKTVTVPTFSATTTPEQAEQALDAVGLTFLKAIDQDSDLPKDTFVSSNPASGESVKEDTEVTVYFSAGPDAVIVPNVAGLSQEQARAEIEGAGLVVDPTVDQEDNGTVKKGLVTRTDPAANASAPRGRRSRSSSRAASSTSRTCSVFLRPTRRRPSTTSTSATRSSRRTAPRPPARSSSRTRARARASRARRSR